MISDHVENHANRKKNSFTFKQPVISVLKPSVKNKNIHRVIPVNLNDNPVNVDTHHLPLPYNADHKKLKKILNLEKCLTGSQFQEFNGRNLPENVRMNTFIFKQPSCKIFTENKSANPHPYMSTMHSDDIMKKNLKRDLPLVHNVVSKPTTIESLNKSPTVTKFVRSPVLQTENEKKL